MSDPLLEAEPPQWRIESLQLVNWGSWHGHHKLVFDQVSTLLSGASGSGKSTVMDAYTALMMPRGVAFNGASNDVVSGRARSESQRNEVSYIRGKQGEVQDASANSVRAKVLRGTDGPTWSAVGATFVSSLGEKFTVFRVYHLPAGATSPDGITMRMATYPGEMNLSDLQDLAGDRFPSQALEKRWPGLQTAKTYADFSARMTLRLGIGREDGGLLALRLLARVQAGHAVSTVDDTYKSMVLETPDTFAAADEALKHFDSLELTYEQMRLEERQRAILHGITAAHDRIVEAQDLALLLDSFGVEKPGDTPMVAWATDVEAGLVDIAEQVNSAARAASREAKASAAANEAQLEARLAQIRLEQDDAGGSALDRLDREIDALTAERDLAQEARRTFDRHTAALDPIESAEALAAAAGEAVNFTAGYEQERLSLGSQRTALTRDAYPVHAAIAELKAERESLEGRSGRVPKDLHDARVQIAQAAGLPVEDFPFVAELLDVPEAESQWRLAIETLLFGLARTLLIDESVFERVSQAIDPLRLGLRVKFQAVPAEEFRPRVGDTSRVSGKLVYKPSPFTNWVASRISSAGTDAVCVASARDLNSDERRVTPTGQLRDRKSGAHGRFRGAPIIGFTSEERLADIDRELAELAESLRQNEEATGSIDARLRELDSLRAAYQQVQSTSWRSVDVVGIAQEIADLEEQRRAILASSDRLAELARQAQATEQALEDARARKHQAAGRLTQLEAEQSALVDRADELAVARERMERSDTPPLSEEQRSELNALYAQVGRPGDLGAFEEDRRKVAAAAMARVSQARRDIERDTNALIATFKTFNLEFGNDNDRGETLQDYDDFKAILDALEARGLTDKRYEFAETFAQWTSDDLVPLLDSFERSLQQIEDRMVPVNAILATLDFGPQRQRLRIDLSRKLSQQVKDFLQDLRKLSSNTTRDLTPEEVTLRFTEMRNFLNRLRVKPKVYVDVPGQQPTEAPCSVREAMLDVRRHVKITAVASDQNGTPRTTYDTIGHLSGGETQELVAFIVGAALRYQLGDEDGSRSTFAPVWLDEAFIKADSEFTGRAVNAWLGFGFQLIVAAPNEKMSGLEPMMAQVIAITKSSRGHSNATPMLRSSREAA